MPRVLRLRNSLGNHILAADGIISLDRAERWAEWILTEHADGEGLTPDCGRPLDESAEVVEIGSLHLILGRLSILGLQACAVQERAHHHCGGDPKQEIARAPPGIAARRASKWTWSGQMSHRRQFPGLFHVTLP